MTWKNAIKKDEMKQEAEKRKVYRESESLYDDFYELLEDINGLIDNMKYNAREGDLINKEIMEKVVIQMRTAFNTLSDYY